LSEAKDAVKEQATSAKDFTKAKADEFGVTEKASAFGEKAKEVAVGAAASAKETSAKVYTHYQNGTLVEAT